jgi:hypothetical protein
MSKLDWGLATIVILGVLISLFGPEKKRSGRKARRKKSKTPGTFSSGKTTVRRTSKVSRSDDVIRRIIEDHLMDGDNDG